MKQESPGFRHGECQRDPTRGYKLYPDGYPEVVWAYGKPVEKGE